MRARIGVIGRLDVWQCGQLDRDAQCAKFILDVVTPAAGPDQAFLEAIAQSLLIADLVGGCAQRRIADIGRP